MADTKYQLPEEYEGRKKSYFNNARTYFLACAVLGGSLALIGNRVYNNGVKDGSRQATESAIALIDDEARELRGVAQNLELSITNMTSEVGIAQTLGKVTGLESGAENLEYVGDRLGTKIKGDKQ